MPARRGPRPAHPPAPPAGGECVQPRRVKSGMLGFCSHYSGRCRTVDARAILTARLPTTNRRRDRRIYLGREPIGGGTRGYT
eukprot:7254960-Pyramimonas_sp.AAC.1